MLIIMGAISLGPVMKKIKARKAVQKRDDELEVNACFVMPQTPCSDKFFAIAI
ncbi:MAG TPA: hypothetical protein VGK25_03100 [Ignavibacteria bacterium]